MSIGFSIRNLLLLMVLGVIVGLYESEIGAFNGNFRRLFLTSI